MAGACSRSKARSQWALRIQTEQIRIAHSGQASYSWNASSRLDLIAGSATITAKVAASSRSSGIGRVENAEVAAGQEQGMPAVLFPHRPWHRAQQQRSAFAAQLDEHMAQHTKARRHGRLSKAKAKIPSSGGKNGVASRSGALH